jgi:hypothetical protein
MCDYQPPSLRDEELDAIESYSFGAVRVASWLVLPRAPVKRYHLSRK